MVTILEAELSKKVQAAIDKADIDLFQQLMDSNKIHGNSFLHASNRKNAYPMLNRAMNDWNNKNYLNKIKIADIIIKAGGSPDMGAPYGYSALMILLHDHLFLRITAAKFELYQMSILFAYELVVNRGADVNFVGKQEGNPMQYAISIYLFYERENAQEMMHVSYKLVEAMLEKGAKIADDSHARKEIAKSALLSLVEKYEGNTSKYKTPEQAVPWFETLLEAEFSGTAKQIWNREGIAGQALRAIALLQECAYFHSNWGFGRSEMDAIQLLEGVFKNLDKAIQKQILPDFKKLCVPQKNLYEMKSDYEKKLFHEKGEILPMKPCYDDAVYARLYRSIIQYID